ncbi:hypothetical protein QDR37_03440 [Amnibacterium sp. CER49]|uniref:protealysin inhibitor emfourin n=1 Tax=Amnibacterium sp. CER49 TaxID=3039161 RepID=UPI00244B2BB4|nr:protealysin inhibitor emfourin [Amnibacterium sp. CER49]MDH2442993.1 hypothetical protein [Amnibacterium sp. CER49]
MGTDPARVRIERSGGFAGLVAATEVSDPDTIRRLLAALPTSSGSPVADAGAADRFVYRFEIERVDRAASPEVLEVGEQSIAPHVRRLLADLLARRA